MNSIYYNEVLREIEQRKVLNKRSQIETIKEIYSKIPRIKEIDDEIASLSINKALESLSSKKLDLTAYKEAVKALKDEKISLLEENGYAADSMDEKYTCPICKDTGFVNGKQCACFKKELIKVLYADSHVDVDVSSATFDRFIFEYYSDISEGPNTISPLQNIKKVVKSCIGFTNSFDTSFKNLCIMGKTGVGKTFLTNCIANEVINTGHSVVYISAVNFFETFFKKISADKGNVDASLALDNLFEADLLILDDLGTETINSYSASHLFNCLNERLLTKKSTIITTNLSFEQIKERYSDRIFSRIISDFELLNIYGEDIRIIKRNWRTD